MTAGKIRVYTPFARVWVAWGRWWAVQITAGWYCSLGVHIDPRRPILDIHLGWAIIAIGRHPVVTHARDRHRHTCRGMLFSDDPIL